MESLQFVDCHNFILEKVARLLTPQEIENPRMQRLFDAMLSYAKGEQSNKQNHVLEGLAAPQLGKPIRVILVDVKADGKGGVSELRLYINPAIIFMSSETTRWYEGCFSTGQVKGVVERANRVTIKAFDRQGHELQETHEGYVARIFQHEIDHINGIRFPRRIPSQQQLHLVKPEEMPLYPNAEGWRYWKATISQNAWKERMKQKGENG